MTGVQTCALPISIDGGLARSPYFAQFLADVLQRVVVTQRFDELTSFGAAALAALGVGHKLAAPRNTTQEFRPKVSASTAAGWRERFAEATLRAKHWL